MGTSGLEQGLGHGNIQYSWMAKRFHETKVGWLQRWKVQSDALQKGAEKNACPPVFAGYRFQ